MKHQVVILAGGLGTRLRPITEKVPKPMVEVTGQPFLYWQLLELKRLGFLDVVLLVSYLGEKIEEHFGNGESLGMSLQYGWETEPLGTGGAIKNAIHLLEEEFFVLNGDSFLRAPMDAMARVFDLAEFDALIATYDNRVPVPVPPNLKVKENQVIGYEKGAGLERGFDRIDAGIYLLKRQLFAKQKDARFQLESLWPALIQKHKLGAFLVGERFYDIGTPERLKEFEEKVRDYFKDPVSR